MRCPRGGSTAFPRWCGRLQLDVERSRVRLIILRRDALDAGSALLAGGRRRFGSMTSGPRHIGFEEGTWAAIPSIWVTWKEIGRLEQEMGKLNAAIEVIRMLEMEASNETARPVESAVTERRKPP